MSLGTHLGVLLILGLFGLLILIPLWPGPRQGRRLLTRWHVPEPTEQEIGEAVTYLRRRRFWYPWLFVLTPELASLAGIRLPDDQPTWSLLAVLMLGALIAELLAQRPHRGPVHSAGLTRRTLTDLVPVWALVLHTALVVTAVVVHGSALAGAGWARHWTGIDDQRTQWAALVVAVGSAALVWAVLGLTLRRPALPGARVDTALRVRSGRVVVGLGVAVLSALVDSDTGWLSLVILVLGIAMWSAIASQSKSESRTSPARVG
jgi:hypothetical protein